MAEDPEVVAIANDEVGHHTLGAAVVLQDCEPLLRAWRKGGHWGWGRPYFLPGASLGHPWHLYPNRRGKQIIEGGQAVGLLQGQLRLGPARP